MKKSLLEVSGNRLKMVVLIFTLSLIPLLGQTVSVSSQANQYDPCVVFNNCLAGTNQFSQGEGGETLADVILRISYLLIYIGGALSVLFIVIGAYRMMASNGNESDIKAGRTTVVNAIIGLVIAIISVTIVQLIGWLLPGLRI